MLHLAPGSWAARLTVLQGSQVAIVCFDFVHLFFCSFLCGSGRLASVGRP